MLYGSVRPASPSATADVFYLQTSHDDESPVLVILQDCKFFRNILVVTVQSVLIYDITVCRSKQKKLLSKQKSVFCSNESSEFHINNDQ